LDKKLDKKVTERMERNINPAPATAGTSNEGIAEINLTGMVIANPIVSCRIEGDGGALLFNPDIDDTLLINPTGLSVWTFLVQPRTIDDIISYLTTLFSGTLDRSAVKQDVEAFIRELAPNFIFEVDANAAKFRSS